MPVRRLAAALAFAAVLLAGCREAHGATSVTAAGQFPLPATGYTTTPGGVPVSFPEWFVSLGFVAQAESAIDAAGVPAGWVVEVTVPAFVHPRNPARLAEGITLFSERRILVGASICGAALLPLLAHEVDHARHPDDPCFGHAPGDCD